MIRSCTIIWMLLLALTLLTYVLGVRGGSGQGMVLLVLGIAVLKAQLVADYFMGLRKVAGFWRPLIAGYLAVLVVGIALAFTLTT